MMRYYGNVMFKVPGMGNVSMPDMTKFATIAARYKQSKYSLPYRIREGERPEQIAKRLYGKETFWYLIYLYNDMDDIMNQWPMTEAELRQSIAIRYPDNNPTDVHHYVDPQGVVQSPLSISILRGISVESAIVLEELRAVSIEEYETDKNDKRRDILLLDPDWLGPVERALFNELRRD